MDDKNRLETVIEVLKQEGKVKNVTDFARQIGYSPPTLANILNGNNKLSSAIINTINEKFPFISLAYLKSGTLPIKTHRIPYIQEDQFGVFGRKYNDQKFMESVQRETISFIKDISADDLLFDVPYHHPDKIFVRNDLALARKVEKAENSAIYYALSDDYQFTLGICVFKDERLVIESFDPLKLTEDFVLDNILGLWKVWGIFTTKMNLDERYMGMPTPTQLLERLREFKGKNRELEAQVKELRLQLKQTNQ
mgnify:CR=1 FL=1